MVARAPRLTGAVLVVLGVALAYAWPLVDGASGVGTADVVLRILAAVAASLAAAHCATRTAGGIRLAWGGVVAGAQVLAAVWVADLVVLWGGALPLASWAVESAYVLLALVAAGALFRLATSPGGVWTRRLVEAAALACAAGLLVWGAVQLVETPTASALDTVRVSADALLMGVGLLALLLAAGPDAAGRWPTLGAAGVALATADLLSLGPEVPPRLTGGLWCAGLVLLAAAAVTGPLPTDATRGPLRRPRWLPPLLLAIAAPPVGAAAALLRPDALVWVPVALAVSAALLLLLLARQQLLLTERREQVAGLAEQSSQFEYRAFHDDLTGLANRALFLDRVEHALELHRRHHRPLTVLFGDLDAFKEVNDRHGHDVGNQVLAAVAERLRGCVRPADTLARLSGDEFAILLEENTDVATVVRRIAASLAEPFEVNDASFDIRMSVGTAPVGADEPTPTAAALLRQADERMFQRKGDRAARSSTATMPTQRVSVPALEEALPDALDSGELTVVYQPLVDPGTGGVVGLEALARWRHGGQQVPPPVFIGVAQRLGLLPRLTAVVADAACEQLRRWCDAAGHERLTVAVNLEREQLVDAALQAQLRAVWERHGLRPGQLVLEFSAAGVLADSDLAAQAGRELAEHGTPLSLSGLGAEAGLGQLHLLSLARVKVRDGRYPPNGTPVDDRLLRALKGLGRELDVQVVVENVERQQDLTSVRLMGGLLAQGFALARPSVAGDLDAWITNGVAPA